MNKWLIVLLGFCGTQAFAEPPKVEISSLYLERAVSVEGAKQNRISLSPGSTRLTLLLLSPDRPIVGIDRGASKLEKFTDDKVNSAEISRLTRDFFLDPGAVNLMAKGSYCQVAVSGPLPSQGATKVIFKATFLVRRGVARKTVVQKNLIIKNGTKILGGPVPMEISDVYKDPLGRGPTTFAVKFLRQTDRDVKFEFLDATGKEVSIGALGSGWDGKALITLPHSLLRATLRFNYWDEIETITTPVLIETGIGLDNSAR